MSRTILKKWRVNEETLQKTTGKEEGQRVELERRTIVKYRANRWGKPCSHQVFLLCFITSVKALKSCRETEKKEVRVEWKSASKVLKSRSRQVQCKSLSHQICFLTYIISPMNMNYLTLNTSLISLSRSRVDFRLFVRFLKSHLHFQNYVQMNEPWSLPSSLNS